MTVADLRLTSLSFPRTPDTLTLDGLGYEGDRIAAERVRR